MYGQANSHRCAPVLRRAQQPSQPGPEAPATWRCARQRCSPAAQARSQMRLASHLTSSSPSVLRAAAQAATYKHTYSVSFKFKFSRSAASMFRLLVYLV